MYLFLFLSINIFLSSDDTTFSLFDANSTGNPKVGVDLGVDALARTRRESDRRRFYVIWSQDGDR